MTVIPLIPFRDILCEKAWLNALNVTLSIPFRDIHHKPLTPACKLKLSFLFPLGIFEPTIPPTTPLWGELSIPFRDIPTSCGDLLADSAILVTFYSL